MDMKRVAEMLVPFPPELQETKVVSGTRLTFVEWYHYLLEAALRGRSFSTEIRDVSTHGDYLYMVVRVTDNESSVYHEACGLAFVGKDKERGYGGAGPEAESQALRRAFAKHGLGLLMYMDDEEKRYWARHFADAFREVAGPLPVSGPDDGEAEEAEGGEKEAGDRPPTEEQMARLRELIVELRARGYTEELDEMKAKLAAKRTYRTAGALIRRAKKLLGPD